MPNEFEQESPLGDNPAEQSDYGSYQQELAQDYDPYNWEAQNNPPEAQQVLEPDDSFSQQYPELLPQEEPEGVVIYQFVPEITDYAAYLYNTYDVSFNTLLYLSALGYPYAQWQISWYRGQILYDICDVYNGRYFPLNTLLDDARSHAAGGSTPGNWQAHNPYYPPAPIFAQTHPQCRCSLACLRPRSYQEIPDNAPGIPMTSNRRIIVDAKKRLLAALSDEYVNAHTFLDPDKAKQLSLITLPEEMNQLAQVKKYKSQTDFTPEALKYQRNRHIRKWDPTYKSPAPPDPAQPAVDYATPQQSSEAFSIGTRYKIGGSAYTPVELVESIIYASPSGLLTPLSRGYRGFVISMGEETSQVYLVQLNHVLELPNDCFAPVKLRVSRLTKNQTYGGMYVYVDDMLGITFKVFGKGNLINFALVYIPELNNIVEVREWRILERS